MKNKQITVMKNKRTPLKKTDNRFKKQITVIKTQM